MKHSIVIKFLVILLTACSLVAAVAGGAGIVAMEAAGLYVNGLEVLQEQEYNSIADTIAKNFADYYAAKKLSNLTYAMRENIYFDPENRGDAEHWVIGLRQGDTPLVTPGDTGSYPIVEEYTLVPVYPIVSLYGPEDEIPAVTGESGNKPSSSYADILAPEGYLYHDSDTVWEVRGFVTYHYYYYEAPEYTVTVYMRPEVLESSSLHILTSLYPHRYTFIIILAAGLLLFAMGLVYLIWAAGWNADGKLRPGGLNRLPLDLYAIIAGGGIVGLSFLLAYLMDWVDYEGPHPGNLSILAVNLLGIILLGIGFLFAFSAQVKIKGFWWKHSLTGWICNGFRSCIRWVGRVCGRLLRLLPLVWQWIAMAALLAIALLLTTLIAANGTVVPLLIVVLLGIVTVCYGAYAYGKVLAGAKRMAGGNLNTKISTRFLFGSFADCANYMNALADVAVVAARNQMKSDRMKTELITNVSHDIKTPLTSIINYVDLLSKPHSPQEAQQYLEVLGRQSMRMKKLIEDLTEMSKVSSGNMTADIIPLDAAETVNQALGEFSDKLVAAQLTPVFEPPEQRVPMLADGRLAWRVLSNLLSNIVKYAQPNTRVYVDLNKLDNQVLISLKNISREALNVSADELTERFVRGDSSRNTEGSGLGLHIAKSLMELQNGRLHIMVDGDLFKATLIFPAG